MLLKAQVTVRLKAKLRRRSHKMQTQAEKEWLENYQERQRKLAAEKEKKKGKKKGFWSGILHALTSSATNEAAKQGKHGKYKEN